MTDDLYAVYVQNIQHLLLHQFDCHDSERLNGANELRKLSKLEVNRAGSSKIRFREPSSGSVTLNLRAHIVKLDGSGRAFHSTLYQEVLCNITRCLQYS